MLVAGLVRLQLNSFLYVLKRRTILFLLGMSPGTVHVSNAALGIDFDGARVISDGPIPVLMFIFGVAAQAIGLAIFRIAFDRASVIADLLVVVRKEDFCRLRKMLPEIFFGIERRERSQPPSRHLCLGEILAVVRAEMPRTCRHPRDGSPSP